MGAEAKSWAIRTPPRVVHHWPHLPREVESFHLTQSVFDGVLQKSIPEQIRQLDLYVSKGRKQVYGFGELTSAKRLSTHFV